MPKFRKDGKKSPAKKTSERRLKEKKETEKKNKKFSKSPSDKKKNPVVEIIEEKQENLEEQIKQGEEEISDSGFVEFLKPIVKTAPVLERVATARNVELENKIADIPAGRRIREDRTVNYSETKPDYSATANVERRENPREISYVEKTASYSTMQKKEEAGRMRINPIKSEWVTGRKRADRPNAEVGSFDRIEREKQEQDKKYLEKGMSEYYR